MRTVVAAAAVVLACAPASAQFTPGDLYVASWKSSSSIIYHVDPATWTVTTFADNGDGLDGVNALTWTPSDTLLASSYNNDTVFSFDALGVATVQWDASAGINGPFGQNGLAATLGGDLFVSNFDTHEVLQFAAAGGAATVFADAGDGVLHPDGLAFDQCGNLLIANRDAKNVLSLDPHGVATVFDTLPDTPMSIAVRNNGDIYVACLYGDIYRYVGGVATLRNKFLSFGRRLATPCLRFGLNYGVLYFTSSGKGNLLVINPDDATTTEVLPAGTFALPLSLEVVGERHDVGILAYGIGLKGAGDVVPTLDGAGHPVFNQLFTLQIRDFVGGAVASISTSTAAGNSNYYGGTAYIDFTTMSVNGLVLPGTAGVPGDGDLDLTSTIQPNPAHDCLTLYVQVFAVDPAALSGVSMSNAVAVTIRSF